MSELPNENGGSHRDFFNRQNVANLPQNATEIGIFQLRTKVGCFEKKIGSFSGKKTDFFFEKIGKDGKFIEEMRI